MARLYTVLMGGLLLLGFVNAQADSSAPANPTPDKAMKSNFKSPTEEASYAIGADIGTSLKQQLPDLDITILQQGMQDAYKNKPLLMSSDQIEKSIVAMQKQMMESREAKMKEVSEQNAKAGKEFLENNKKQKGVNTLPTGLQYKVIETGKGDSPSLQDTVTVDYEGKLISGTVFDSSYQRGEPASFKLSQVISGWQQALQKMKAGDTWEIYVPADLAYGTQGIGPIGPNETLIFKVHLQKVEKSKS